VRLYLVNRTDSVGRDEYRSAVIASRCEGDAELEALAKLPGFSSDNFTTEQIAARTNRPYGIVLASFNAG